MLAYSLAISSAVALRKGAAKQRLRWPDGKASLYIKYIFFGLAFCFDCVLGAKAKCSAIDMKHSHPRRKAPLSTTTPLG